MKMKFSKNHLLSIFVFLVLLVLVVLAIYYRTPETDWINNAILGLTAFVLLWYTLETAEMKAEVVKQNRLLTRPILVLEFDNRKPFLKNEGKGPALNASVTEFEVRSSLNAGSPLYKERFDFVLPVFISMGSRHELRMYKNNPGEGTKGTLSEPDILLELGKQIKMMIRYEDIEGGVYTSSMEIQSGMSKRVSFKSS